MRLWAQARTSGTYVARVMTGDADAEALGFNYEIFTHTTRFFGLKVILLGLYNGQKLEHEPESDVVMYTRSEMEPEPSFVRVLLLRGRMVGAVLVGETELEETFEISSSTASICRGSDRNSWTRSSTSRTTSTERERGREVRGHRDARRWTVEERRKGNGRARVRDGSARPNPPKTRRRRPTCTSQCP